MDGITDTQRVARFSPVGETLIKHVLRKLLEGPAKVDELDEYAKNVIANITTRQRINYDHTVWLQMLRILKLVEVENNIVRIAKGRENIARAIAYD